MTFLGGGGALGHLEESTLNHAFSVVVHSAGGTVLCLVQHQHRRTWELEEADEDLSAGP